MLRVFNKQLSSQCRRKDSSNFRNATAIVAWIKSLCLLDVYSCLDLCRRTKACEPSIYMPSSYTCRKAHMYVDVVTEEGVFWGGSIDGRITMVKLTLVARVTDRLPLAEGLDDDRDQEDIQ